MMDLSIIIPYRNTPIELLRRLITSINDSLSEDIEWEICIVDDYSHIELSLDHPCLPKFFDKRVKLQRLNKHSGIGAARNIGYQMSSGQYISFVDSDDILVPNGLGYMFKEANKNSLIFSDHKVFPANGDSPYLCRKEKWIYVLEKYKNTSDNPLLYCNFIVFPILLHRSIVDVIGGYPNTDYAGEHVTFYGRLSQSNSIEFKHIPFSFYEYWPRKNGHYLSNLSKHIFYKGKALSQLANEFGFYNLKFSGITLKKHQDATIYLPFDGNKINIPEWAEVDLKKGTWDWNYSIFNDSVADYPAKGLGRFRTIT